MKLLSWIFIIKLIANSNIFTYVLKKHGQKKLQQVRELESLMSRYIRLINDIKYIKSCKRDDIIPTFARVSNSVVKNNRKLNNKVSVLILNSELEHKHNERRDLLNNIKTFEQMVFCDISSTLKYAIRYKLVNTSTALKDKLHSRHEGKLSRLKEKKNNIEFRQNENFISHTINNFSSYVLSEEEKVALCHGLEQHIPSKLNENNLKTEFECLYQDVLRCIPTLSEEEKCTVKTKLRNTCEKYANIRTPFPQRRIVDGLMKNDTIHVMKQDKGRGVVIMDRVKYIEKCQTFLNTPQFKKLTKDPTTTTERKIQNTLRKIKSDIPDGSYRKLYPTGSRPGQFYGLAKVHKLKPGEGIESLPLRPIISNIGTASYQIAKHLAKLLSPLSRSEYTVSSTDDLTNLLKTQYVPADCDMISFDVTSLFTNVPLEFTIDVILRKVYDEKLVDVKIPRKEMKELLLLCTKSVHFTFNGDIYQQLDGVAMGSPLGPVIAGIFMVELENTLIPTLVDKLLFWRRYVDDTLCFVKKGKKEEVLIAINNFHENIVFTCEEERNNMIAFLDVLLIRQTNSIDMAVFRKETNTGLYINWNAFAPKKWKTSTLKMLVRRAYLISTKDYFREMELSYLRDTFRDINNFPQNVINRIFKEVEIEHSHTPRQETETVENTNIKEFQLTLPYAGKKGESIAGEVVKCFKKIDKVKARISYKAKRLISCFNLKDEVQQKHQHNVVYEVTCPDCDDVYIGETGRRLQERLKDHCGRDKNSHVFRHSFDNKHGEITMENVKIINKNYNNYYKRKVSEAIFIKSKNPILNTQDTSVPLKLFN